MDFDIFETLKIILGLVIGVALLVYVIKDLGKHNRTVFNNLSKAFDGGLTDVCLELGMKITKQSKLSGEAQAKLDSKLVTVSWVVGYQHGYDPSHCKTFISIPVSEAFQYNSNDDQNIKVQDQSLVLEISGVDSNKEQLDTAIRRLIAVSDG